jgi:uncharacterized protein YodC (DUF2158 family)
MTVARQSILSARNEGGTLSKKTVGLGDRFPKGSVVRLISGGPAMSVKDTHFDNTLVCQWFSGKKLETGIFAPETLVVVKDEPEDKQPS